MKKKHKDAAAELLRKYSKKLGRPPEDIVTIGIIFCFSQAAQQKILLPLAEAMPAALRLQ
jgi:hypothetical protein